MRIVVQRRIVEVIQKEIAEYRCDRCGSICGTKENRKETWHGQGKAKHYCKKTCSPRMHPQRDISHVLNCELCYAAADKSDPRIAEAVLRALEGKS